MRIRFTTHVSKRCDVTSAPTRRHSAVQMHSPVTTVSAIPTSNFPESNAGVVVRADEVTGQARAWDKRIISRSTVATYKVEQTTAMPVGNVGHLASNHHCQGRWGDILMTSGLLQNALSTASSDTVLTSHRLREIGDHSYLVGQCSSNCCSTNPAQDRKEKSRRSACV